MQKRNFTLLHSDLGFNMEHIVFWIGGGVFAILMIILPGILGDFNKRIKAMEAEKVPNTVSIALMSQQLKDIKESLDSIQETIQTLPCVLPRKDFHAEKERLKESSCKVL